MALKYILTDHQKKKAREWYRSGKSRSAISRLMGLPVGIVYKVTSGVTRTPKAPPEQKSRGLSPEQVELLRRRYAQGETVAAIAPALNRSVSVLYKYLPKELRRPPGRPKGEPPPKSSVLVSARAEAAKLRNDKINQAYLEGKTTGEIGELFGISPARVAQILKKYPRPVWVVAGAKKALQIKLDKRAAERTARKEACCLERYGVPLSVFQMIQVAHSDFIPPFLNKKRNAATRGAEWHLSLLDWVAMWSASGKWDQRGRSPGKFGLARLDSSKPYDKDNCFIGEFRQICGPARRPGKRT